MFIKSVTNTAGWNIGRGRIVGTGLRNLPGIFNASMIFGWMDWSIGEFPYWRKARAAKPLQPESGPVDAVMVILKKRKFFGLMHKLAKSNFFASPPHLSFVISWKEKMCLENDFTNFFQVLSGQLNPEFKKILASRFWKNEIWSFLP